MKVYVVTNVRPDVQVFPTYDKAFEFAKVKADKRRGPTNVWFVDVNNIEKAVYNSSPIWGDHHLYIYEREV